jgi:Predicted metal-dependent hydrolase with the TIM-barrel fold
MEEIEMNNLKADIIYENGQIATMTEKQPFVEAAAVSGGRIIRIGSSSLMEDIIDDSTEIFDLEGRYATPGFIETAESPVITAFGRGVMLPLFDDDSVDAVIDDIEGAVFEKQREGVNRCFGYGFSASLTEGKHDEVLPLLDEAADGASVILLSSGNSEILLSASARSTAAAAFGTDDFSNVDISRLLALLAPIDELDAAEAVKNISRGYLEEGYTYLCETFAPEYLAGIFAGLLNEVHEDGLPFRFSISDSLHNSSAYTRTENIIPAEVIAQRTSGAAAELGIASDFGTLEPGKYADMAIFNDDPFRSQTRRHVLPEAVMTVLSGRVSYDKQNILDDIMFEKIIHMEEL